LNTSIVLLLDQTKGQLHFQAARDLLELDERPCESILIVEFYDDVAERLSVLQSRKVGLRAKILTEPAQMISFGRCANPASHF